MLRRVVWLAGATVDWYVVHKGQDRVFVGCQYTSAGKPDVRQACDQVVRSLSVR